MGPIAGLLFCLLWLCAACTGPYLAYPVPLQGEPHASIYVLNQGWHSGLILRRADIPAGHVPESVDFPEADYLELGWGDRDYYQADDPGFWLSLQAAFFSHASVLRVEGIQGGVQTRFAGHEMIRLDVPQPAFAGLIAHIDRSFVRNTGAKAMPIKPGSYGSGRFYPANGKFHLFHNCNGWTAETLEAAGYPMGLFEPFTAEQLMARVRPLAAH